MRTLHAYAGAALLLAPAAWNGAAAQTTTGSPAAAVSPASAPNAATSDAATPSNAISTPAASNAATGNAATPNAAPGNADAGPGERLARQGEGTIVACASCHGAQGEGNAGSGFPRLSGQPQAYLEHQLAAYADGSRHNPVMEPIAKSLNDAQRASVARYYARLEAAGGGGAEPLPPTVAASGVDRNRAQRLTQVGDEARQVQACINCHGPGATGRAPNYPYLAGQHASYLEAAMAEWQNGTRRTDPSGQMMQIAKSLDASDVKALAAYYAGLPAPTPLDLDQGEPWLAQHSAVVSGPRPPGQGQGGQEAHGVGTETAPVTGGGQGPGGGGATSGAGAQGSPSGEARTGGVAERGGVDQARQGPAAPASGASSPR